MIDISIDLKRKNKLPAQTKIQEEIPSLKVDIRDS